MITLVRMCVLDTSVASMVLRNDSRARFYRPHIEGSTQYLSFQTVAEMREGSLLSNWGGQRRQSLETFFTRFTVVPFRDEIASEWARIRAEGTRAGLRLEAGDAWIAATAAAIGALLLTHDADFSAKSCPGVTVIRYDNEGSGV